jgi:hypothetical protein
VAILNCARRCGEASLGGLDGAPLVAAPLPLDDASRPEEAVGLEPTGLLSVPGVGEPVSRGDGRQTRRQVLPGVARELALRLKPVDHRPGDEGRHYRGEGHDDEEGAEAAHWQADPVDDLLADPTLQINARLFSPGGFDRTSSDTTLPTDEPYKARFSLFAQCMSSRASYGSRLLSIIFFFFSFIYLFIYLFVFFFFFFEQPIDRANFTRSNRLF